MDTLTILKTMRAVVADVDPRRFDMEVWFDRKQDCGCIMGLTLMNQPRLARETGLGLKHRGLLFKDSYATLMMGGHPIPLSGSVIAAEIARATGLTTREAQYLFCQNEYRHRVGAHGKKEALRRLDEMIAKYSAPAAANADAQQ